VEEKVGGPLQEFGHRNFPKAQIQGRKNPSPTTCGRRRKIWVQLGYDLVKKGSVQEGGSHPAGLNAVKTSLGKAGASLYLEEGKD